MNIEVLYLKSVLKCSTWVNTLNNFPRLARNVCVSQGVCVCGGRWFEQLSGGTWDRERETAECGGREGGREDALMSYQPPLPLPPPKSIYTSALTAFLFHWFCCFFFSFSSLNWYVCHGWSPPPTHWAMLCVHVCSLQMYTHTHSMEAKNSTH